MLNLIEISQKLFEIIDVKTDRHTHRHIHADENNTCPKTKFLGQVKIGQSILMDPTKVMKTHMFDFFLFVLISFSFMLHMCFVVC